MIILSWSFAGMSVLSNNASRASIISISQLQGLDKRLARNKYRINLSNETSTATLPLCDRL